MATNTKIKSTKTFREEMDFLETHVPSALYGASDVYHFLDDVLEELHEQEPTLFPLESFDGLEIRQVDIYSIFEQLSNSDIAYITEDTTSSLGFNFGISVNKDETDGLANLVAEFGRDAFGCYLPMHAFYNSTKTPWGIYLYPELIRERAKFLQKNIPYSITSKQYLAVYLYAVYRHELFHYQTERFATKLEIAFAQPFFKPYHTNVFSPLQYTDDWLEEALAEASVLESVLVPKRTGIKSSIIKDIYKYDLQSMPPGYRDYHCKNYGGPAEAHKTFAAQIAGGNINPSHKSTALFTIKGEFGADDRKVPVYMITNIRKYKKRVQ
ncbi:hypothetical protein [Pontibacter pamirensis]|uniref:hypothetical protein n=1 Tax=Pontibacter pamirensis TaxID=2562824 RepID=UPI001389E864|nr:hypothetical protein [Pontibacter pamirensis]